MQTLQIAELRKLLAAVSDHGKQHLVEVEADLLQTTYLLNEAIEKLSASFMAVNETVTRQQQALKTLMVKLSPAEIEQLDVFKQKIGEQVNAAVTGLQFQDLTSQLIARTIKRVNGLKDLLNELSNHGSEMEAEQEHAVIIKFLEEMNRSLHAGSNALSGGLQRSVNQQNMAAGEIDLF